MDTKKLGNLGEKIAVNFLKKKGYKILDKNYIPKWLRGPEKKEIDIIAKPRRNVSDILRGKKDDVIHFVEVKTLSGNNQTFLPEDKVNFLKQRKIIKAAQSYLLEKKISPETKWQVDVIAIKIDLRLKKAKIKHLKNIGS
jgi:putative endonuclease